MKHKSAESDNSSDNEQHSYERAKRTNKAVFDKDGGKDGAAGVADRFQDTNLASPFKHGEGYSVSNDDQTGDHSEGSNGGEHDDKVIEDLIDERVDIDDAEDDGIGNGLVQVLFESWQLVGIDFE